MKHPLRACMYTSRYICIVNVQKPGSGNRGTNNSNQRLASNSPTHSMVVGINSAPRTIVEFDTRGGSKCTE